MAAAELARRNLEISVSFVTFACSGAEIYDGFVSNDGYVDKDGKTVKWGGRETQQQMIWGLARHSGNPLNFAKEYDLNNPDKRWLIPQVTAAVEALCPTGEMQNGTCAKPIRKPDYVIMSTGGNEIGFSSIVENISKENFSKGDHLDKLKLATDWWFDCSGEGPGDNSGNAKTKKCLDKQFEDLHTALKTNGLIPDNSANVLLVPYLDPTRARKTRGGRPVGSSRFCDSGRGFQSFTPNLPKWFGYKISRQESKSIHNMVVKPLNKKLAGFAADYGWRVVPGVADAAANHGFCSKTARWFYTFNDSLVRQGWLPESDKNRQSITDYSFPTGAMHPNFYGHYNIRAQIVCQFAKDQVGSYRYWGCK
jgi:hypothetical protein